MKQNDFQKVANQVSFVTIVVNILLAFMKLLAGVFAHSNAMISDSIHSASDVFSTMIVVIGIKLSSKQPDKEHPYGHERMECVSSIILSGLLLATGIGIGMSGIENIIKSTLDGSLYDRSGDWRGGAYGRAQGRIQSPAGSGNAGAGSGCYIYCQ